MKSIYGEIVNEPIKIHSNMTDLNNKIQPLKKIYKFYKGKSQYLM